MQIIKQIVYQWRLWKICRRLDIKLYPWQRDYALGRSNSWPVFSRSGKTMAVILYGLVRKIHDQDDLYRLAWQRDPGCRHCGDFEARCRQDWFYGEYLRTARRAGLARLYREIVRKEVHGR